MRPANRSFTSDLLHPLPLAAVAVLAVNDHLLKGSGLLPGWLTGKLSDFAGLFFFPVLLVAVARLALRVVARRDLDLEHRRALVGAAVFATGAVFTLLKLHPPFNAWVEAVWGVNSMDATDLWALPVLPLSAAFMLRREVARAGASPARRALDLAAVALAGLASIATSAQRPPVPPPAAVAAAPAGCAALWLRTCERSANMTFVTVAASAAGPGTCAVDVTRAIEVSSEGGETPADMLPSRVVADHGVERTFALSFLRPVSPAEQTGLVSIRLDAQQSGYGGARGTTVELVAQCTRR